MNNLQSIARALVTPEKGILAADESTGTIQKRFDKIGVANTVDNRRAYRELLFTTPNIQDYISGVIFFDETIHQSSSSGVSFVQMLNSVGIIPGIKVDKGPVPFANSEIEKSTTSLEGLNERLAEYYKLGARFAKWRAIYNISEVLPSPELISQNARDLATYASLCQANNIVPVVEPEVLMDGSHTIERCFEVTSAVLKAVFEELKNKNVDLSGMLLKPNMILAGSECAVKSTATEIAEATIKCLRANVPPEVPGIVFLSGGQSEKQACETLNEIQKIKNDSPWELSFSYGRALQDSTLKAWIGKPENIKLAQEAFLKQARAVSLARTGKY